MSIEKENVIQFNQKINEFLITHSITLDQFWILHLKYFEDEVNLIKLCTNIKEDNKLLNKIVVKKDKAGNVLSKTIESNSERFTHDEMYDLVDKNFIEDFDYDKELRTTFITLTEFGKYLLNTFYNDLFPKTQEEALLSNLEQQFGEELFDTYPNTAYSTNGGLISQLKSFKHMPKAECFKTYFNSINGNKDLHLEVLSKIRSNYSEIKAGIPVGNYNLCIGFTKFVDSTLWKDLPLMEDTSMKFQ